MGDKVKKRMVENYEIIQGIRIGDREVVFGVDERAEMPYFCAFCSLDGIFETYHECMVSEDYVEMTELFADRVKAQCVKVHEQQSKVAVTRGKVAEEICRPLSQCGDIVGKVMVVRAEALRPEYRSVEHQLIYVTGGNGARENSLGTACYCITLYSGERGRWERYELLGEVRTECMPEWAEERLNEIRKKTEKSLAGHLEKQEERL